MTKKITKAKLHQIISTVLGILCVGIILFAAFAFPKYYCLFNDTNTLNKLNYMDISVNTYETAYSSFAEKIHALARVTQKGKTLQAVQVNEPGMEISKKELTDIVNEEIANLFENDVLPKKIKMSEKKNSLSQRYTIYEADKNSSFKGISCWKLVYNSSKRTVTIYLDEEYHKIFYIKIQQKKANTDDAFINRGKVNYAKWDKVSSNEMLSGYQENFFAWWDGMLQYYGLSIYKDAQEAETDDVSLTATIHFNDKSQISIGENYFNDIGYIDVESSQQMGENDNLSYFWDTGIQMEKMIQF